jgi:hypothetical protein
MQGIPSLAITTEHVHELLARLAHTPADTLDVVDPAILAGVVGFLREWVYAGGSTSTTVAAPMPPPAHRLTTP